MKSAAMAKGKELMRKKKTTQSATFQKTKILSVGGGRFPISGSTKSTPIYVLDERQGEIVTEKGE